MPMMRRGPLDRYPPEWVLRQANAHQVGGSIEFHTSRPATFYLDDGRIYAAAEGVALSDADRGDGATVDEAASRMRVVDLLAQVLGDTNGWYFHDPLDHHPGRGAWVWETATLLMETRAKAHEVTTLAAWVERTVSIQDAPSSTISLGADAWALVVQLAGTASSTELRGQLGWQPDRMVAALTELEQRGVLSSHPASGGPTTEARARPPAATLGPAAPVPSSPPTFAPLRTTAPTPTETWPDPPGTEAHHTGPLAPPPTLPGDRTAKRRRLPGRRTARP